MGFPRADPRPHGFRCPLAVAGASRAAAAVVAAARHLPPAPKRLVFPAIRLLRDLPATENAPAHTPWWLLALRIAAAALLVLGLARPVLAARSGAGRCRALADRRRGWASARRLAGAGGDGAGALESAGREGRRVALLTTAPPENAEPARILGPYPSDEARARLANAAAEALGAGQGRRDGGAGGVARRASGPFATLYLADGVEHAAEGTPLPQLHGCAGRRRRADAGPRRGAAPCAP